MLVCHQKKQHHNAWVLSPAKLDNLSNWWQSLYYFERLHDCYCQLCDRYAFYNISFLKKLSFVILCLENALHYYLNFINLPSCQWRCSDVFIVNFGQIFFIFLVFPFVDFEQVNTGWVFTLINQCPYLFFFPFFQCLVVVLLRKLN